MLYEKSLKAQKKLLKSMKRYIFKLLVMIQAKYKNNLSINPRESLKIYRDVNKIESIQQFNLQKIQKQVEKALKQSDNLIKFLKQYCMICFQQLFTKSGKYTLEDYLQKKLNFENFFSCIIDQLFITYINYKIIKQMSVYSGFATRQQQTKYNTLLETLVIALKKRLIKFYQKEECDEGKFKVLIKKVYKKMYILEKGKFMVPKYTSCFTDLIEHLNINIDFDSLSDASSRISASFSLHGGGGNEQQQHIFKSRNILQTKRNFLSTKVKQQGMDSAFSLKNKINTFGIQNQQQAKDKLKIRSSSLGMNDLLASNNNNKKKTKIRQLKQLKELRGTMHMPKVEDFLPKKQQIQPALFSRQHSPNKQFKNFRRQKYSRNDVHVQQV